MLDYDQNLLQVDQQIAHIIEGAWQVGRISSVTYQKKKWAEYGSMPPVKSHKKKAGMVPPEYTHAFHAEDYGSLWVFVNQEWNSFMDAEMLMSLGGAE